MRSLHARDIFTRGQQPCGQAGLQSMPPGPNHNKRGFNKRGRVQPWYVRDEPPDLPSVFQRL